MTGNLDNKWTFVKHPTLSSALSDYSNMKTNSTGSLQIVFITDQIDLILNENMYMFGTSTLHVNILYMYSYSTTLIID